MSCTELIFFNKKGNISKIKQVNNGRRSAYAIWERLFNKYYVGKDFVKELIFNQGKNIFNMWKEYNLNEDEIICLLYTFDYCIVEKNDIDKLIKAMRKFHVKGDSLLEQSNIIESIFKNNKNIRYLGCHQIDTSCYYWYDNNCLKESRSYFMFKDRDIFTTNVVKNK